MKRPLVPWGVLLLTLIVGCQEDKNPAPEKVTGILGSTRALFVGAGVLEHYDRIQVYAKDPSKPVAEEVFQGGFVWFGLRWFADEDKIEIVDLPEQWTSIVFVGPGGRTLPVIRSGQPLQPPPRDPPRKSWFLRNKILALLFVVSALYAVLMVGVTGGPNHGEHPFIIAVMHLIAFLIFGQAWTNQAFNHYLVLVIILLVLSMAARITVDAGSILNNIFRVLLLAVYIAMFWVLTTKATGTTACMASPKSILIHVEEGKRNRIAILDAGRSPIRETQIDPAFTGKTLYFWDDPSWAPPFVRVIAPDGTAEDIEIKNR